MHYVLWIATVLCIIITSNSNQKNGTTMFDCRLKIIMYVLFIKNKTTNLDRVCIDIKFTRYTTYSCLVFRTLIWSR